MDNTIFENIHLPFILKTTINISDFDKWINTLRIGDNRCVVVLRGERMQDFTSFDQEIAAALQFPYYYGHNWDAFDECINDLKWFSAKIYIIGITNSQLVLSKESKEDQLIFGRILKETSESWSKPLAENKKKERSGIPFHVIMQCENKNQLNNFGKIFDSR